MKFLQPQIHWALLLLLAAFVSRVAGDFVSDANALIKNHKTVRLDPLLRRALLKALTELEEEAQIKAEEEEKASAARAAANDKLQEAVETADPSLLSTPYDEIQTTADTSYPTPAPLTVQETVAPTTTEAVPTTTPSAQESETTSPHFQTEAQTSPTATIQDTFFFHTPAPLDGHGADFTKAVSLPDIESNLITDDGSTLHQSIGALRSREELTSPPTQQTPTSPLPVKQVQAPDNDVEIFKAPLAAAFTLHQDDKGTPQGVVPLFRPQNNNGGGNSQFFGRPFQRPPFTQFQRFPQFPPVQAPPQNFLIQQSQNTNSFTLSPSQQLARLQQAPDQFLNQFPPQGFQQPQPFQPSPGPFGFHSQAISGQQHLPSAQAPLIFNQQHQQGPSLSSVTVTPHSEPLNGIKIPSSTLVPPLLSNSISQHIFPVSTTINPPPFQSSTARPVALQSSTPQSTFTIPPVTLPLQNEPRFQSPIIVQQPSQETRQFLENQNNRQRLIAEENRLRQLEGQAHFRLQQVTRQRENEENRIRSERFRQQPADFQRSLGFTLTPDPFQFQTNNRVNRQEPFASTGNFGFNNNQQYRTLPDEVYRPRQFRSPQQELAQFLYQSGVATHSTGQEDLNIVSKVLALNHQRSDEGVSDSLRTTNANGFRPTSFPQRRSDDGAISSSERRRDEKTLLVGEIKEFGTR